MGIQYHPDVGEALWCNYHGGIEPEMIKRRLAIVLTPKASQRHRLVTVVPISSTPPNPVKPWHARLDRDPWPQGNKSELWVKCDMINVVCFERLFGNYSRWNGKREYRPMRISLEELRAVRAGVLNALGLAPKAALEERDFGPYHGVVPGQPG